MQRCRLPVDPRGTAVTATGRSQRTRIRSGIFDFRSVHLIQIRVMEPVPLFENNIFLAPAHKFIQIFNTVTLYKLLLTYKTQFILKKQEPVNRR